MQLVVADTGPLHYLVLAGDIELLPKPSEHVLVPRVVRDELADAEAPQAVRDWIAHAPGWLDMQPDHPGDDDVAVAKLRRRLARGDCTRADRQGRSGAYG